MNEELWSPDELKREEIRGVFVIGLIATFLSIRPYIETHVSSQILINPELIKTILLDLTTAIIPFWGIYLFLIAVSLSDDIRLPMIYEKPWISKEKLSLIKKGAHLMYIGGISMVLIYILFLLLFVEVIILVLLSPIIIFVLLPYKLLKKFVTKIKTNKIGKVVKESLRIP